MISMLINIFVKNWVYFEREREKKEIFQKEEIYTIFQEMISRRKKEKKSKFCSPSLFDYFHLISLEIG